MTIKGWILKISKGYRSVSFRFDSIADAESFLLAWIKHKESTDEFDEGKKDTYTIAPEYEQ